MARAAYLTRLLAVLTMLHFSGDAALARPLFEKLCPNHGLHESIDDFLRRWYARYEQRKEGECFLAETNREGPRRRLVKKDIETAVAEFPKGYWSNKVKRPFHSVEQVRGCLAPRTRSPLTRTPHARHPHQQHPISF